ncbi:apoptosis-inducing factor 3 [Plutella xylostella]|uniref:apoptosis-inducing factor 3 n=1 Tax=Plutella xylostella TaxID=51655 RepID=UPI002032B72F|nr:apoptosis-inducing factor 3 [Plutella xylostella]
MSLFVVFRASRVLNKAARSLVQGTSLFQNSNMGTIISKSLCPNGSGPNANTGQSGASSQASSQVLATNNYVEAVVCNENDLKENEMKVFDIGDEGKVLLVKQKGEFSAVGHKCTHYGAPLVAGALSDGRIRCQWHGACFNLKTGDIEDFPGFDSLPCYQVTVGSKGEVKVRAKISDLKSNKRIKEASAGAGCAGGVVVVVGAGPSGGTCAETLRSEGFQGRIVLLGKEPYLPYDRVKVSKLTAHPEIEKLQARTQEYYNNANIEVMKGVAATKVEPEHKFVHLSNGTKLQYSALYLATGSKPRVPDVPGADLQNIFTLRNIDDTIKLIDALGDKKDKNLVVLGLSYIGLETAASYNEKAKSVTVVGTDSAPLAKIFGTEIGQSLQKLFEEKGVKFHFNTTIVKCNGENGAIKSVELRDGTTLPADVVVFGVGTTLYTDFLRDSGIAMEPNGAVTVDDKLQTNIKDIFAGGDIAHAPVFANENAKTSVGHIGLSQYHGRVAALNILKKNVPLRAVPYFWTMLFGKSIRYAGTGTGVSTLVDGDVAALKFVIFFFNEAERVVAVASCMRDPVVSQFAEFLHQGKSLYKKDLEQDRFAWTKTIQP